MWEKTGSGGERMAVAVVEKEAEVCSLEHVLIGLFFEWFKGKEKKRLQNSKPFYCFHDILSLLDW